MKKNILMDMRKYPRVRFSMPVGITFFIDNKSITCKGTTIDVSLIGIGMALYHPNLPPDIDMIHPRTPVKLTFTLPSFPDDLYASGIIRWKQENSDKSGLVVGLDFSMDMHAETPFIVYSHAQQNSKSEDQ